MPIVLKLDTIDETGLEQAQDRYEKIRTLKYASMTTSPASALELAALTIDTTPAMYKLHESIPNLWVVHRRAKALAVDVVTVTCTYGNILCPPGGDASAVGRSIIRLSSVSEQATVNYDAYGNLVRLGWDNSDSVPNWDNSTQGYSWIDTANGGAVRKPQLQTVNLPSTKLRSVMRFTRVEMGIYPLTIQQTFRDAINSVDWASPGDALSWKCTDVQADTMNGGITWLMSYDFLQADNWPDGTSGWYQLATYVLGNGQVDPHATIDNHGQVYVVQNLQQDFNKLNLFGP